MNINGFSGFKGLLENYLKEKLQETQETSSAVHSGGVFYGCSTLCVCPAFILAYVLTGGLSPGDL